MTPAPLVKPIFTCECCGARDRLTRVDVRSLDDLAATVETIGLCAPCLAGEECSWRARWKPLERCMALTNASKETNE